MSKPREFWLGVSKNGFSITGDWDQGMYHLIEKSAADQLVANIEGEIRILEATGVARGTVLGLRVALKNYRGEK